MAKAKKKAAPAQEGHECFSATSIPMGGSTAFCDVCGTPTVNVIKPAEPEEAPETED